MKGTTWLLAVLACGLLALGGVGCKRRVVYRPPHTLDEGMTQLRAVLATASPDVQRSLYTGVAYSLRYGRYPDALAALDRIDSDPSLNGQQHQVAGQVADLLKQKLQDQQNGSTAR